MPDGMNHRAFYSGDVLLSHGLSPYYHRGCSVSLPCSEWERVGPLRYCHQSAEPHRHFAAVAATQARGRISEDIGAIKVNRSYLKSDFKRTLNTQLSTINGFADSLTSTYRSSFRLRTADATTFRDRRSRLELRFVLRSFISHYCPESFRGSLLEK